MPAPALAVIEFSSIAAGTTAADALMKRAPLESFQAGSIQPGRYLILFTGGVAEVDGSFHEALRVGGDTVLDRVLLPEADASVHAAVGGKRSAVQGETLGIIETPTVAAAVHAADAAVKCAAVTLLEIRLGDDLHGKGLLHLDGDLADVQAAIAAGTAVAAARGGDVRSAVIPNIDSTVTGSIGRATTFQKR